MRKIIFSMLLASVAASPALAQDRHERGDRNRHEQQSNDQSREERQQAREQARAQREAQRSNESRVERPQVEMRRPSFQAGARADATARADRRDVEQIRAAREAYRQSGDGVSRWNRDNVQRAGETSRWTRQPEQRAGETSRWTRDRSGGWTRPGGEVNQAWQQRQPTTTEHRRWSGSWNRDWRNDRRYDWRRYRDHHRSTFRIGIYYDPFGYNYRRFDIGYRLTPAYYGQRYWFDPSMYGLPYPPPGTQWVRYWNDALLVDIYSGQVIDAIQNFFW